MLNPNWVKENSEAARWGRRLREWRRLNHVKQAALAFQLGVSQPTISRWESGEDFPSPAHLARLQDMIIGSLRDECALERLLVARQSSIRTLMDMDGMRLDTVSAGYQAVWPQFSTLIGTPLADRLINEGRTLLEREELMRDIRKGTIGMISGISERHLDLDMDMAIKHRWHMCFRHYGARIYADITFERCDIAEKTGILEEIRFDAFGAPFCG